VFLGVLMSFGSDSVLFKRRNHYLSSTAKA
jgi:hypothetical protein